MREKEKFDIWLRLGVSRMNILFHSSLQTDPNRVYSNFIPCSEYLQSQYNLWTLNLNLEKYLHQSLANNGGFKKKRKIKYLSGDAKTSLSEEPPPQVIKFFIKATTEF